MEVPADTTAALNIGATANGSNRPDSVLQSRP